ncbi:MAG: hypothetical protein K6G38_00790 [Gammaproteobacteria bacterium]|nr:hypothetical protein [Gammaproteobacteria bacterium]
MPITKEDTKQTIIAIIVSGLIDICAIFLLYFGLFAIELKIEPLSNNYYNHQISMVAIQDEFKLDYDLAHKTYEGESEYEDELYKDLIVHLDEDGKRYKVINNSEMDSAQVELYQEALKNDTLYQNEKLFTAIWEYILRVIAAFISELILLLIIPLTNKKRATLGKLAAKCSLIDARGVFEASWFQVLGRFLWTFTVETAILAIWLNPIIVLLIVAAFNFIVILISKNSGRTIRDYVTHTKVVESSSFTSIREMKK